MSYLERDLESAKQRLFYLQTPPTQEKPEKNDYGMLDKIKSRWTAAVRKMILAVSKKDRKGIRAAGKVLRNLAEQADRSLVSVEYTQQAEEVAQAANRVLQLLQKVKKAKQRIEEANKKSDGE